MTFTIDLNWFYALANNPYTWLAVYIVGLYVAANIAMVKFRRYGGTMDEPLYVGAAFFWPLALIWLALKRLVFIPANIIEPD